MASRRAKSKRNRKSPAQKARKKQRSTSPVAVVASPGPREIPELQLKPKPWSGERDEDVAVFAKERREQLTEPLQAQALAVSDALDLVAKGNFTEALARVQDIPRSSPYAEWRLLLRGLVNFYQGDTEGARQNWKRLDPERRPARIAATLVRAETDQPLASEVAPPPDHLVRAAVTLRLRREAIDAARRIAAVRHRDEDRTFSPSQISMLSDFRAKYQRLDPEFCLRFSQACVRLACCQPFPDLLPLVTKGVDGPPHDPRWLLLEFSYMSCFRGGEVVRDRSADAYLEQLASLDGISADQRNALGSHVCFLRANKSLEAGSIPGLPFNFNRPTSAYAEAESWLAESLKWYPANREAHRRLIDLLDEQIEILGSSKHFEARLVRAKEGLVAAFPNEVDTALWLIDHYFDEDQLEKVEKAVSRLGELRLDDPRAKALPWKLRLREAMRHSKRKKSLDLARESLEGAAALWPTWFSTDWLPFLRAALELRCGARPAFEKMDAEARRAAGVDSWVGDFYTFAALQQMNLPAGELKEFRQRVDAHVQAAPKRPLRELLQVGPFFWDLTRAGLRHKAYRLQAAKLGKVLCKRLAQSPSVASVSAFADACCWIASHRFWMDKYSSTEPDWVRQVAAKDPKVAASVLEWLLGVPFPAPRIFTIDPLIQLLEDASRSEKDPFYRYRFENIAKESRQRKSKCESQYGRSRPSPFSFNPEIELDFDDEDDEDDDEDFIDWGVNEDGECNCPDCRAERAREAKQQAARQHASAAGRSGESATNRQPKPGPQRMFPGDGLDEHDEEYEGELDEEIDLDADYLQFEVVLRAAPRRVATTIKKLGEEGLREVLRLGREVLHELNSHGGKETPEFTVAFLEVMTVFMFYNVKSEESIELLRFLGDYTSDPMSPPRDGGTFRGERDDEDATMNSGLNTSVETESDRPFQATSGQGMSAAERRRRQREKKRNRR